MTLLKILLYTSLIVLFYTYIGYGMVLYLLLKIKGKNRRERGRPLADKELPEVTLLVTAYNERDFVDKKLSNSLALNYPKEKLKLLWVTDGSDDGTPELLKKYPQVTLLHQEERRGKIVAMNRAVVYINSPIIIFSDANTMLGRESIRVIAELFQDPKIGSVAGEKRVEIIDGGGAAAVGEGLYWRYESLLKRWDAQLYSAVGAAGELFAVRRELYKEVEPDTLLDDFIISLRIAMAGYRIGYDPNAYALERPSASIAEELKRKIRIGAGGFQSIARLKPLLNPFKYGVLSFQYLSHRVLRWAIAPFMLPILLFSNIAIVSLGGSLFYTLLLVAQSLFYLMALLGLVVDRRGRVGRVLYIPLYFTMMNYALYRGLYRHLSNRQSVVWERAKRG